MTDTELHTVQTSQPMQPHEQVPVLLTRNYGFERLCPGHVVIAEKAHNGSILLSQAGGRPFETDAKEGTHFRFLD